jgi:hypothetical protein
VRLVAERDGEGHADRFWAGALGLAGGQPEPGLLGWMRRQAERRGITIPSRTANQGSPRPKAGSPNNERSRA